MESVILREWRPSLALRGFACLMLAVLAVGGITIWVNVGPVGVVACLAFAVIGYRVWTLVLTPRLVATADGLEIRNGRRVERLPWRDIVQCEPGYWGLIIICADGRQVLSPVPQKANLAKWFGWTTKSDRAARYIEDRARDAHPTPAATSP